MAEGDFDKILPFTLREEGGNVDDPHDHGGRTSRGVTQRRYDIYRAAVGRAKQDVYKASAAEVREVYHRYFWNPWCGKLPGGVDLLYFDFAVNAGPAQATRSLQRALGLSPDGALGQLTLSALAACDDIAALCKRYGDQRRAFYRALKQFPLYGKNWTGRANRAERAALALVNAPAAVSIAPGVVLEPHEIVGDVVTHNPAALAHPDEVATPPLSPETGVAATVGSATAAEACGKTAEMLQPFADTLKIVQYALFALAVVGLLLTAYGILHARRTKAAV